MISFNLGRLPVSVSFWFFTVVALFCVSGRTVVFFYIALPVIIHEAGHVFAAISCRIRIYAVSITAFGIDMRKDIYIGYNKEIILTLGGAVANLLAAALWYALMFQSVRAMFFVAANIATAMFNLLPVGNLDGGELVRLLGERFGGVQLGRQISKVTSFLVLVPLFAASILMLLRGSGNVTMLITCLYLAGVVVRT